MQAATAAQQTGAVLPPDWMEQARAALAAEEAPEVQPAVFTEEQLYGPAVEPAVFAEEQLYGPGVGPALFAEEQLYGPAVEPAVFAEKQLYGPGVGPLQVAEDFCFTCPTPEYGTLYGGSRTGQVGLIDFESSTGVAMITPGYDVGWLGASGFDAATTTIILILHAGTPGERARVFKLLREQGTPLSLVEDVLESRSWPFVIRATLEAILEDKRIANAINRLGAPKWADREAAERELRTLPYDKVMKALERAIRSSNSAEMRKRAKHLRAMLLRIHQARRVLRAMIRKYVGREHESAIEETGSDELKRDILIIHRLRDYLREQRESTDIRAEDVDALFTIRELLFRLVGALLPDLLWPRSREDERFARSRDKSEQAKRRYPKVDDALKAGEKSTAGDVMVTVPRPATKRPPSARGTGGGARLGPDPFD